MRFLLPAALALGLILPLILIDMMGAAQRRNRELRQQLALTKDHDHDHDHDHAR